MQPLTAVDAPARLATSMGSTNSAGTSSSSASVRPFFVPSRSSDALASPPSRKRRSVASTSSSPPAPPSLAFVTPAVDGALRRLARPLGGARRRRAGLAAEVFASSPSPLPPLVADALLGSRAGLRRVFRTDDAFPAHRYALVREWERAGAAQQVLHAAVALDRADGKHVVLTCLAKAIVTEWCVVG